MIGIQRKVTRMANDTIYRQAAIDALNEYFARIGKLKRRGLTKGEKAISLDTVGVIETLLSAQPEALTDKEQRIFLAAMNREEKVCKQVDDECRDCREAYEDSLVSTCHEITRKVKDALWTI